MNRVQRRLTHGYRLFRTLPPRVAWFIFWAQNLAILRRDTWTQVSSLAGANLPVILRLAKGSREVVELGTASGWTSASLALADPSRSVTTYDPVPELAPYRGMYLRLAGRAAERITLLNRRGDAGPSTDTLVDFLFIDSSHHRADTVAEFYAWRDAIRPGGLIVFDDYGLPEVRAAIEEDLLLDGEKLSNLFVWRKPPRAQSTSTS